jgi:putative transposase
MEAYLKELFQEIAQEKEFEVVMMEVGEKDHICISTPQNSSFLYCQNVKGNLCKKTISEIPSIKKKNMGWTPLEQRLFH